MLQEGGWPLRRCEGCALLFVSPRPTRSQIAAIYEHDAAQTASRQQLAKNRDPAERAHARLCLSLIGRTGSLLEIGPGGGLFLKEASEAGFTVTGLDPNPVQVNFIRDHFGLPCLLGGLEALPSSSQYSVIYHCNVLSHLPDPLGAFRRLADALEPGGVMLFETGNYADVDPRYYRLISSTERFQLPDHLCFLGKKSLEKLLDASGLKLLELHRYSRLAERRVPEFGRYLGLGGWARRNRHFLKYGLGKWLAGEGDPQAWIVKVRRA